VSSALQQITQIAAPCAAVASAIAAYLARATVERANRPFVASNVDAHPAGEPGSEHPHRARVELQSIGPGIALNVRCSLRVVADFEDRPAERKRQETRRATKVVVAFPPGKTSTMFVDTPDPDYDDPYWIVVRWSDSAQRRWERTHEHSEHDLAAPAHRIRGQRLARRLARRPWHWWWWSMLRRSYTVPPRITARQARQW
jgi:hypothetical protein